MNKFEPTAGVKITGEIVFRFLLNALLAGFIGTVGVVCLMHWWEILKTASISLLFISLFMIADEALRKINEHEPIIPVPQEFPGITQEENEAVQEEKLKLVPQESTQSKYIKGEVKDLTRGLFQEVDKQAVKTKLAEIAALERLKPIENNYTKN